MLKKGLLSAVSLLVLFPNNGFCTIEGDLTNLDLQRNEVLKEVTTGLVNGKISIEDAQKLKNELDGVIKLETAAKEDTLSSPERLQEISKTINQIHDHVNNAIHPTKLWLGIDSQDKTLEQKITNALNHKLISKERAEEFKQQWDELRARESNGDPSHGFEFEDAMSLAVDVQTLNSNIDRAISGKY